MRSVRRGLSDIVAVEIKTLNSKLAEEASERSMRDRELVLLRQEWDSQAKRMQATVSSLKRQAEEKEKTTDEAVRQVCLSPLLPPPL